VTLPTPELLLAAADTGRSLPTEPAGSAESTDIHQAFAVQATIGALRRRRGDTPVGYKIGFTNRLIWPLYGVKQPIWGPIWQTTLHDMPDAEASISLALLAEPRLEPEIVIGLTESPPPQADASTPEALAALLACIGWVAPGFEVVHSIWPNWRFSAAQAIAAQSLHAGLWVGPRLERSALGTDPAAMLSRLHLTLSCQGEPVAQGRGADVLDGPIQALGHLVGGLAARGERIAAGSVITTGTLTDAQPLAAGQHWRSAIDCAPLSGLSLKVNA
jgi:2-oxo-3-hexenedioate decarboxylase